MLESSVPPGTVSSIRAHSAEPTQTNPVPVRPARESGEPRSGPSPADPASRGVSQCWRSRPAWMLAPTVAEPRWIHVIAMAVNRMGAHMAIGRKRTSRSARTPWPVGGGAPAGAFATRNEPRMETARASVAGMPAERVRPSMGDGNHVRTVSPTASGAAAARRRALRKSEALSGLVLNRMTHKHSSYPEGNGARNDRLPLRHRPAGPSPLANQREALANHSAPGFGKGENAKKFMERASETDRS